jgi:peptidoglycan/LPS O-acetylase OafA/YrhL
MAVISFYILAGFVVNNLFSKIFVSEKPLYFLFYYERTLRIFPQYLFIASLTFFFILITKYGSPVFSPIALINNILIIPLNYYMVLDNSILQEPKWWLIPPAWSLGVELQAYLILPFIIYFKPLKIIAAIISLTIFIVASIGIIHTDYFGYRLIPGILFIFILGTSIYNNTSKNRCPDIFDKYFPKIVYLTLILLLIILYAYHILLTPYVRETILGILIGIPIITYIANSKIKLPINHFLGDLSYGIFLSHFLSIWIIEYYTLVNQSINPYSYVAAVFIISLFFSCSGVFIIENSIKKYRLNLSKNKNPTSRKKSRE